MEEQEYRDTYHSINQRRCVFEKAINSRRCDCASCHRFNLADREGVACRSGPGNERCSRLLDTMRSQARFALHLTHADAPLPHTREIKVQVGGLLGIQALVADEPDGEPSIENVTGLLDTAMKKYGSIEDLPYNLIVQAIVSFEGRKRRG